MKIELLKLLNFRNYKKLEITFHPNLNVIYGKNGSGKTNLVEAIYVLGLTRSFRLSQEKTLIHDGSVSTKIEGLILNKYKTSYTVLLNKEGKKVKINDHKVDKLSDYITKITIILFHPDDLRFIKDTPSTRRKNLNISISEMNLEYLRVLNNYNKLLKQRNAYLKQMLINHHQTSDYLDILTSKLIELGIYIYEKRNEFIEQVNSYLAKFYERITGLEGLKIGYISSYEGKTKEELFSIMKNNLPRDLSFGKTNIGVHMDDLVFLLKDKNLKEYGSEGQQKNAIIAYKFSELEIFRERTGYYPILILDDLFSELDEDKVSNILKMLNSDIQTFITTTNLNVVKSLDCYSYKQIHIEDGKIIGESENYGKQ